MRIIAGIIAAIWLLFVIAAIITIGTYGEPTERYNGSPQCQQPFGGHGGQGPLWNGCDYGGWGGFGGWGINPFPANPWMPGQPEHLV